MTAVTVSPARSPICDLAHTARPCSAAYIHTTPAPHQSTSASASQPTRVYSSSYTQDTTPPLTHAGAAFVFCIATRLSSAGGIAVSARRLAELLSRPYARPLRMPRCLPLLQVARLNLKLHSMTAAASLTRLVRPLPSRARAERLHALGHRGGRTRDRVAHIKVGHARHERRVR